MKFKLEITPALVPSERHQIEDQLKKMGYHVLGGGTSVDMSACDVSFENKPNPSN